MSDQIKQLATQILAVIKDSRNILLHCHPSPDPDSMGGALATKFALQKLGKQVTVIAGDSDKPKSLSGLPGFEEILPVNFLDILKQTQEDEQKRFDLFISLDSSGVDMVTKLGPIEFPPTLKVVVIDHHVSNTRYGQINLVDDTSIATCEILFELFQTWGIELDHDIALNLFMGIYTDSGGFKYPKTTAKTFEIGAKLVQLAPDFTQAIFIMDNSNQRETLMAEGLLLNSITTHYDGKVAIASVSFPELETHGIKKEQASQLDIANKLISVIGWEVGISMVEKEPEKVSISMRTRDSEKFDVSKLAQAIGGGGHKAAAGARLTLPLKAAKELLIGKLKEIYLLK